MRYRVLIGLIIIASVLALGRGAETAAALTIAGGVNISNTIGTSEDPVVAADESGGVIVAWTDHSSGTDDIFTSQSRDGGQTWTPAFNVSDDAAGSDSPAVWITESGSGVAWVSVPENARIGTSGTATGKLIISTFKENGPSGEGDEYGEIADGVATNVPPAVVSDDAIINVLFGKPLDGGGFSVFAAQSDDGGASFSAPQYLDDTQPGTPPNVELAKDGDFWMITLDADGSIEVYGQGFVPNHTIAAGARKAWIKKTVDGVVVYWETKNSPIRVFASYYADGTWVDPFQISGPQTTSGVAFAESGQTQLFAWTQLNEQTDHSQVVGRASFDGGLTFQATFPITSPDIGASSRKAVLAGDTATILYREITEDSGLIPRAVVGKIDNPFSFLDVEADDALTITDLVLAYGGVIAKSDERVLVPASELVPRPLFIWTAPPPDDFIDDIFAGGLVLSGDADCSGGVNSLDALAVLRGVAALPPAAGCLAAGDVNCSGGPADSIDALFVLREVASLGNTLPSGCPEIGT